VLRRSPRARSGWARPSLTCTQDSLTAPGLAGAVPLRSVRMGAAGAGSGAGGRRADGLPRRWPGRFGEHGELTRRGCVHPSSRPQRAWRSCQGCPMAIHVHGVCSGISRRTRCRKQPGARAGCGRTTDPSSSERPGTNCRATRSNCISHTTRSTARLIPTDRAAPLGTARGPGRGFAPISARSARSSPDPRGSPCADGGSTYDQNSYIDGQNLDIDGSRRLRIRRRPNFCPPIYAALVSRNHVARGVPRTPRGRSRCLSDDVDARGCAGGGPPPWTQRRVARRARMQHRRGACRQDAAPCEARGYGTKLLRATISDGSRALRNLLTTSSASPRRRSGRGRAPPAQPAAGPSAPGRQPRGVSRSSAAETSVRRRAASTAATPSAVPAASSSRTRSLTTGTSGPDTLSR
jgi:hypothetical protein